MLNLEASTDGIYTVLLFFQHHGASWTDDFIEISPGNV